MFLRSVLVALAALLAAYIYIFPLFPLEFFGFSDSWYRRTPTTRFWTSPTGTKIPLLIYGTAWKKEQTASLVDTALGSGFLGIDTANQARHYNEPAVGEALSNYNKNQAKELANQPIFLQTKVTPPDGQDLGGFVPYDVTAPPAQMVKQSFESSLKHLQVKKVDSLLLHSPLSTPEDTLSAWRAMEDLKRAGHVAEIGISNFYNLSELEHLYQAAELKPTILQNRFHSTVFFLTPILAFLRRKNILLQLFWTLANEEFNLNSETASLALKHQVPVPSIVYDFLISGGLGKDLPVAILDGTKNRQHMAEDLAVSIQPILSPDEIIKLRNSYFPYSTYFFE